MESSNNCPTLTVPPGLLKPHSESHEQLLTHFRIIHLLHHRSVNQHKSSIWYRHFNVFRREVRRLCTELEIDLGPGFSGPHMPLGPATNDAKRKSPSTRLAPLFPKATQKVKARLKYWLSSGLVSRCYTAFSTLATTPSFSPLALTLLAVLARICSLTGVIAHLQALARVHEEQAVHEDEEQLSEALERFAEEDAGELFDLIQVDTVSAVGDVGVSVKRPSENVKSAIRPTKRSKKANAIDDLFDGL